MNYTPQINKNGVTVSDFLARPGFAQIQEDIRALDVLEVRWMLHVLLSNAILSDTRATQPPESVRRLVRLFADWQRAAAGQNKCIFWPDVSPTLDAVTELSATLDRKAYDTLEPFPFDWVRPALFPLGTAQLHYQVSVHLIPRSGGGGAYSTEFTEPSIECSSRLLRKLRAAGARWIAVAFHPEYRPTHSTMMWTQGPLSDGVTLFGHTFDFLSISTSQMRAAVPHAIFLDRGCSGGRTAAEWRQHLLPHPPCGSVHTFVARLGLYHTDDRAFFTLPFAGGGPIAANIPDVYARDGKTLLTDGCGFIARAAVAEHLERRDCSLVQFRYGGAKGVLLVVDDIPAPAPAPASAIALRPSQVKFSCADDEFCVVDEAAARPFTVNREILTLLTGLKKASASAAALVNFEEAVLDGLHDAMIAETSVFTDAGKAREAIMGLNATPDEWRGELPSADPALLRQPFMAELLWERQRRRLHQMTLEMHVPFSCGARLFGCADPYGLLRDGEVYACVQLVRDNDTGCLLLAASDKGRELLDQRKGRDLGYRAITGPRLMVFRNPCLHPGDVQLCRGRDLGAEDPRYTQIRDVVLFPCNAEHTTYSIPHRCSGGDLDGDEFSVVWDAVLTDGFHQHPHGTYDVVKPKTAPSTSYDTSVATLAPHIVACLGSKGIGGLSTLHTTICELLPEGATHPKALKLAEQQNIAIDAVKTGVFPTIDRDVFALRNERGIPDFLLDKKHLAAQRLQRCFHSTTIIGRIFRQHKGLALTHIRPADQVEYVICQQLLPALVTRHEVAEALLDVVYLYNRHAQTLAGILTSSQGLRDSEAALFCQALYVTADEQGRVDRAVSIAVRHCFQSAKKELQELAVGYNMSMSLMALMIYIVPHFPDLVQQHLSSLGRGANYTLKICRLPTDEEVGFRSLGFLGCVEDPQQVLEWFDGQRISNAIATRVNNCRISSQWGDANAALGKERDVCAVFQIVTQWAVNGQFLNQDGLTQFSQAFSTVYNCFDSPYQKDRSYWIDLVAAVMQALEAVIPRGTPNTKPAALACRRAVAVVVALSDPTALVSAEYSPAELVPFLLHMRRFDTFAPSLSRNAWCAKTSAAGSPLYYGVNGSPPTIRLTPYGDIFHRWTDDMGSQGRIECTRSETLKAVMSIATDMANNVEEKVNAMNSFPQTDWSVSGLFGVLLAVKAKATITESKKSLNFFVDQMVKGKRKGMATTFLEAQLFQCSYDDLQTRLNDLGWVESLGDGKKRDIKACVSFKDHSSVAIQLDRNQRIVALSEAEERCGAMVLLAPQPPTTTANLGMRTTFVPIEQSDIRVKFDVKKICNEVELQALGTLRIGDAFPILTNFSADQLVSHRDSALPETIDMTDSMWSKLRDAHVVIRSTRCWNEYVNGRHPGILLHVGEKIGHYGRSRDCPDPRKLFREPYPDIFLQVVVTRATMREAGLRASQSYWCEDDLQSKVLSEGKPFISKVAQVAIELQQGLSGEW